VERAIKDDTTRNTKLEVETSEEIDKKLIAAGDSPTTKRK